MPVETQSRVASFSAICALFGAAAFALGPAVIQIGLASPLFGFRVFGLGVLLGFLGVVLGAIGVWRTGADSGRRGRKRALTGLTLGLILLGSVVIAAGPGLGVPAINDITTDPNDPPEFVRALAIGANRGRDMMYPGEEFARQQREGYPDLAPILIDRPPEQVFAEVERAMTELGWDVTRSDAETGTIEAIDVTALFRFVDDIVVRIRARDGGSVLDVRSKSRDGKGDVGANAARIRALRDAVS
jgi:uncharacterized protein (DUF1499 family)